MVLYTEVAGCSHPDCCVEDMTCWYILIIIDRLCNKVQLRSATNRKDGNMEKKCQLSREGRLDSCACCIKWEGKDIVRGYGPSAIQIRNGKENRGLDIVPLAQEKSAHVLHFDCPSFAEWYARNPAENTSVLMDVWVFKWVFMFLESGTPRSWITSWTPFLATFQ